MNFRFFICICVMIVACNGFSISGGVQYQNHVMKTAYNKFQFQQKQYRVQQVKISKQMKRQLFKLFKF